MTDEPTQGPEADATPPDAEDEPRDGETPLLCEVCGNIMIERHCKITCTVCGYQRDCSDP